jgi:hypothetical protein
MQVLGFRQAYQSPSEIAILYHGCPGTPRWMLQGINPERGPHWPDIMESMPVPMERRISLRTCSSSGPCLSRAFRDGLCIFLILEKYA